MHTRVDSVVHELFLALAKLSRGSTGSSDPTLLAALATLAAERVLLTSDRDPPRAGWSADKHAAPNTAAAWTIIKGYALKAGVAEHDLPEPRAIAEAADAAIGLASLPPLSVPRAHYPRDRSSNAVPGLRQIVRALQDEHRLCHKEMADALCHVIGQIVVRSRGTLDPAIATTLAMETLIGVTRMSPLAVEKRLAMGQVSPPEARMAS
jgi:hypothetical protein